AHDDRGPRVLAHGEHAARSDVGVTKEVERYELVVRRGRRVVEDRAELREVPRTEEMRDVAHRLLGELRERLGLDLQEGLAGCLEGGDVIARDESVRRRVGADREKVLVLEGAHGPAA